MEHSTLKKSTKILAPFGLAALSGRPLVDGRDYQQEPDLPRPRAGGARYGRADTTGRAAETRVGLSLPVALGYLLAAACAIPLGVFIGWRRRSWLCNPLLQLLRPISPHRVDPPGYPVVRSRRHLPIFLIFLCPSSPQWCRQQSAFTPSSGSISELPKPLESLISSSFAWSSFPLPCPRSLVGYALASGWRGCGGGGRDDRHQLWPGLSYYRLERWEPVRLGCWGINYRRDWLPIDSCMQRLQQLRMAMVLWTLR